MVGERGQRPPRTGPADRSRPDLRRAIGRRPRGTDPLPDVVFAYALRGYDCTQVDRHVSALVQRCRAEIVRANAAEDDLRAALERIAQLHQEQATEVRQDAARRGAELDAREGQIAAALDAARREADAIRAAAWAEAAAERSRAEHHAAGLLAEAERLARRQRADAEQEVRRLATLQETLRRGLATVYDMIGNAVGSPERSGSGGRDVRR